VTYTAHGRLEIRIHDQAERRHIGFHSCNESYNWRQRWATYRGRCRRPEQYRLGTDECPPRCQPT
jgi:hypothetical protein